MMRWGRRTVYYRQHAADRAAIPGPVAWGSRFLFGLVVVGTVDQPTQHSRRLADAQRRRLEVLEIQAAEQGSMTPPHVLVEIEDLRQALTGSRFPIYPISDEQRYQATMRAVLLLSQAVASMETKVARLYWLLPLMLFLYLIIAWALEHLV